MPEYYPLLIMGAIIGIVTTVFIIAYAAMKDKKTAIGFDRNMKDGEIIRRILKYAKPYTWSFVAVGFLMLLTVSYDILAPILVGEIQGIIKVEDFDLSRLFSMVAVYGSILVISLVSSYFQAMLLQRTGQKILSGIRESVFTHIESLSHAQLNHIPTGKLVTRVCNDTNAISMMFTHLLVNLVKNCFVIVGVLAAMLMLNYGLTLMILCFTPFIVIFTLIFRKFSRRAYRRVKDANTDINTYLSENLSGMKITQIFNRQERKAAEFEARNTALSKARHREILVFSVFRPMVYTLYMTSILCLFYFGASGVINDTVFLGQTIGSETIVSFYMFINKFFNPIQSLAEQFNRLQGAFASAEKIFSIMDMKPQVVDSEDAVELDTVRGDIEFKNVWFAYEGEDWVLRDVSFKISANQTVAFVGSTGSGKTTILSLIVRNYDIQRGQILIDGMDIRRIKISSLRRHFGQMLQDVFLFSGTIRSNIVLREDSYTDEEIREVCDYVNATHFISKQRTDLTRR